MKILLIYPYFIEERIHREEIEAVPIGLYWVGAVLREKHYDVEILNWHNIHETPERIRETLQEKKPHAIGFSILHANRWGGIEIAGIAKQLDPEVKIVFGGIGATFLWEHFLTHFAEIDFVVLGEGEYTFPSLMECFEKEGSGTLENIPGIAFRRSGKVVRTKDANPIRDLDKLPIPAKYFEYRHVSSTRGCARHCTFCGSPRFWGGGIRFRSPGHFVEELEILYKKGITFFHFSDDTFTAKKKRVVEICREILDRGLQITWYAISRVDHVDDEILCWMRRAGCVQISYGIESGSEMIRNTLNKDIHAGQIREAFALTTRFGILARAYFIYGSPGETWETIQETIDLMHEIKPLSTIFYILDIFPGTGLYEDFMAKSGLTDDIWLNRVEGVMYSETDSGLSDRLILSFGRRLRTAFYENVHAFAASVSLIDRRDLYERHADFCSRLAMTFSHGDYSRIEAVKEKEGTAERLYRKALEYFPDHRAFLGLGISQQKNRKYEESIKTLLRGVEYFPESEDLNICLGISYMNSGDYGAALSCFSKFPNSRQAGGLAAECRRGLGTVNR